MKFLDLEQVLQHARLVRVTLLGSWRRVGLAEAMNRVNYTHKLINQAQQIVCRSILAGGLVSINSAS